MLAQSLYETYKRYRTLQTHKILSLPIVILMPHSACNCKCVMCDIWKDNKNLRQLTEHDVEQLLDSLKKLGTQQVVMSGGEALLNPKFFRFCEILKENKLKISLLSTGLLLMKNAKAIARYIDDVIISLDGPEKIHDQVRNIPGAFRKMAEGIGKLREFRSSFPVTGRSVIHRLNFRYWPETIMAAREIGLDQISFLPADVSSHAFNREVLWNEKRQHEILLEESQLAELDEVIEKVIHMSQDRPNFIAESPLKLRMIGSYYKAFYGLNPFPFKKCNAPWVSAVVEADGTVRPCFFHEAIGNIRENKLEEIVNRSESIKFRRELDMDSNSTCVKCVCYLNLSPTRNFS